MSYQYNPKNSKFDEQRQKATKFEADQNREQQERLKALVKEERKDANNADVLVEIQEEEFDAINIDEQINTTNDEKTCFDDEAFDIIIKESVLYGKKECRFEHSTLENQSEFVEYLRVNLLSMMKNETIKSRLSGDQICWRLILPWVCIVEQGGISSDLIHSRQTNRYRVYQDISEFVFPKNLECSHNVNAIIAFCGYLYEHAKIAIAASAITFRKQSKLYDNNTRNLCFKLFKSYNTDLDPGVESWNFAADDEYIFGTVCGMLDLNVMSSFMENCIRPNHTYHGFTTRWDSVPDGHQALGHAQQLLTEFKPQPWNNQFVQCFGKDQVIVEDLADAVTRNWKHYHPQHELLNVEAATTDRFDPSLRRVAPITLGFYDHKRLIANQSQLSRYDLQQRDFREQQGGWALRNYCQDQKGIAQKFTDALNTSSSSIKNADDARNFFQELVRSGKQQRETDREINMQIAELAKVPFSEEMLDHGQHFARIRKKLKTDIHYYNTMCRRRAERKKASLQNKPRVIEEDDFYKRIAVTHSKGAFYQLSKINLPRYVPDSLLGVKRQSSALQYPNRIYE